MQAPMWFRVKAHDILIKMNNLQVHTWLRSVDGSGFHPKEDRREMNENGELRRYMDSNVATLKIVYLARYKH